VVIGNATTPYHKLKIWFLTLLTNYNSIKIKLVIFFFIKDVIVAPIYLHLDNVQSTKQQPNVEVAAQNCSMTSYGAFTGEVAPQQLLDINIKWVILGHSERRTLYG